MLLNILLQFIFFPCFGDLFIYQILGLSFVCAFTYVSMRFRVRAVSYVRLRARVSVYTHEYASVRV